MEGITLVLINTVGAGIGILVAGPLFDCKVPPVKAFAAGAVSGVLYLIPTVGFAASLAGLIYLVGIWGTGEWQGALFTSLIARGVVLIVALLFGFTIGAA